MGRPSKPDAPPPISIMHMERLPKDVLDQCVEMAAKGKKIEQIKKHILDNGYLAPKALLKKWMNTLPLKQVRSVHDLPKKLRDQVAGWWLTRRDYTSCIEDLNTEGYTANIPILNRWYKELLQDEAKSEIDGDFDPTRTPISEELESWALTATLDRVVDAIMRSSYRPEPETPTDFARMADILLKVVNSNISRRKLALEEDNLMSRVRAEFNQRIKDMLSAHPLLVKQIAEIADEAEAELIAQ